MQIAMETDSSELERAFEEGVLIFAKQLPLLVSFLSVAVIVGNVVGKVRIFISDVSTFMVLLFQHIVYRSACCRCVPQFKDLEKEVQSASIKAAADAEKARLSAESASEKARLSAENVSIKAAADADRRILDFITSSGYKGLRDLVDKENERLRG